LAAARLSFNTPLLRLWTGREEETHGGITDFFCLCIYLRSLRQNGRRSVEFCISALFLAEQLQGGQKMKRRATTPGQRFVLGMFMGTLGLIALFK
jgi:hypothetical protein